jgi:uncharacterized protein YwqG
MKPIYLNLHKPKMKLGVGASRFWGNPDLPEGVGYPMYVDEEGDGYPYFFVCQINLEEIASYDVENRLPHKGLMSFFAKIDYYMGYSDVYGDICGGISDVDSVKVLYFPDCSDMREVVLVDDDGTQTSPCELQILFSHDIEPLSEEHSLLALPTHREWETWDPPFEDWEILLQVDSFSGDDFDLNFVDYGVLNLLISPEDLKNQCYDRVRAIVLST